MKQKGEWHQLPISIGLVPDQERLHWDIKSCENQAENLNDPGRQDKKDKKSELKMEGKTKREDIPR